MILDFLSAEGELYQRLTMPVAEKHGLSSMEFAIILFLANNPEHDTATEIVNIRHLTKSHVSTSIRSLVEKGLLSKEYRNGDHRTIHLILSEQTDAIVTDGRLAQRCFYDALFKGFSDEEHAQLEFFMERMNENILCALKEGV